MTDDLLRLSERPQLDLARSAGFIALKYGGRSIY